MARNLFGIEEGLRLHGTNSDSGVEVLFGSGAAGGDAGRQDAAPVGTLYLDETNGKMYQKKELGTGTARWRVQATLEDVANISFRSEVVRAATSDVAPSSGAVLDLSSAPFGDDDAPQLSSASFTVDEHIIFGVGGTPKLMRVSTILGNDITVVDADTPLQAFDNIMVQVYLPDLGDSQEKQALVHYDGVGIVKLGDVNWDLADGINLNASFAKINGTVTQSDTVQSSIEKLAGNQEDLTTLSGMAQGNVDLGTFTGNVIEDNRTIKEALQDLETDLEQKAAGNKATLPAVTTQATLDVVDVDDVLGAEWEVHIREDANPANIKQFKIFATHDGHAGADAAEADYSVFGKLKLGGSFNAEVEVDLSGTGAAQQMRLRVSSSTLGATFSCRRTDIKL
jgi:hypothetical protein